MNVMGRTERDDYNSSMKHGLGEGDARFKHYRRNEAFS